MLGLAFPSVSRLNTPSFIQSLADQNQIPAPVFAVRLAEDGSELTLGGTNSNLYSGGFTYTPVDTEVTVPSAEYSLNSYPHYSPSGTSA